MALQLGLDVSWGDEPARVFASGELDAWSAAQFDKLGQTLLASGRFDVVLDLRDLEFADSSGVIAIARLGERLAAAGGSLTVDEPPRSVRTLARLMGLGFVRPDRPALAG